VGRTGTRKSAIQILTFEVGLAAAFAEKDDLDGFQEDPNFQTK
jgi:hypothetical protein